MNLDDVLAKLTPEELVYVAERSKELCREQEIEAFHASVIKVAKEVSTWPKHMREDYDTNPHQE